LVIVPYWDLKAFTCFFQDVKAFGLLNVFQVDAAERRFEQLARTHYFVWILGFKTNREAIDAAEIFEQQGFAFHHGHGSFWADIA
jgi:hypothetical protein